MSAEEASRIARAAESLRRVSRLPLKVVIPSALALGAGGALAAAQIPGSDGVITACVNTSTGVDEIYATTTPDGEIYPDDSGDGGSYGYVPQYGSVRLIDPTAAPDAPYVYTNPNYPDSGPQVITQPVYNDACVPGVEETVTWNQQGPAGPTGAQGPAGAAGAAGTDASIVGASTFTIDGGSGTYLFAELTGIQGDVTVKGDVATSTQSNAIQLESFAFGAEAPVLGQKADGTVASESAGKAVSTFELVKAVDKTSNSLFQDLESGKAVSKMVVTADSEANAKAGWDTKITGSASQSKLSQDATYTFTDVKIKDITEKGKDETVVGTFTKMESTLGSSTSKVKQSLDPGSSVGYDLTTQKTS